jgi:ATP-dependent Lon protease
MSKEKESMLFRNEPDSKDPGGQGKSGRAPMPLLPLRDIIVFPHMVVPLFVGRQKSIAALEAAMENDQSILLAAQRDAKTNEPGPDDIHNVGTVGTVVQLLRLPDGTVKVLVEGKYRVRISAYTDNKEYFAVELASVADDVDRTPELEALIRSVNSTFEAYVRLNKKIPPEMVMTVASIDDPSRLADTIISHLGITLEDKQTLLESFDVGQRLEKVLGHMRSEMEILEVEKRIRSRVKKQMEKTQKEYYLNEQMRAIQKELGEKDEFRNEIQELEDALAKAKMPEEAREKTEKEIKKLKMMSPMSAEATVVRNYIDWMIGLPWADYTDDAIDMSSEGQGTHLGIPRGDQVGRIDQRPDTLLGRPAGCRQDVARSVNCEVFRPKVRAYLPWRRSRRS